LSGNRFLLLGVGLMLAAARLHAGASEDAIRAAIEHAVQARVGSGATVAVSAISGIRVAAGTGAIVAQPESAARIGEPVRFLLSTEAGSGPARIGEATAVVTVVADAVRTRRDVSRGARLEAGDLEVRSSDLRGRPFGRLPSLDEIVGARVKRDIGADAIVTAADVAAEALVHAGDVVRAHIKVGQVEIVGQMVAVENGGRDAVIRVINQETRHATRARIIGRAEVEVVNVP
jgi:flagella basal body P-ring formation protein FlgA